jgi:hypothetical protein
MLINIFGKSITTGKMISSSDPLDLRSMLFHMISSRLFSLNLKNSIISNSQCEFNWVSFHVREQTELEFLKSHRGGIGFSYRPARLHRLAEFIPWNQCRGPINI